MTNEERARRNMTRLRSIVRRAETGETGATPEGRSRNWQASCDAAAYRFEVALRAVVAVEDAEGVEAAGALNDRLTKLRQRAVGAGLMSAGTVLNIEREVCCT